MNAEDADAVRFMEVASHLGYLGYTVTPPPTDGVWYTASHSSRWSFVFSRWRRFLWLRCVVNLPDGVMSDSDHSLERINGLRGPARLANYHLAQDESGTHVVEATAFLPIAYDRQEFGEWMLQWIEETSRISASLFRGPVSEEKAS